MAAPNLSEIVSSTLRNRSGEFADNVTKDLALLIGPDQDWATTEGFIDTLAQTFEKAMS